MGSLDVQRVLHVAALSSNWKLCTDVNEESYVAIGLLRTMRIFQSSHL